MNSFRLHALDIFHLRLFPKYPGINIAAVTRRYMRHAWKHDHLGLYYTTCTKVQAAQLLLLEISEKAYLFLLCFDWGWDMSDALSQSIKLWISSSSTVKPCTKCDMQISKKWWTLRENFLTPEMANRLACFRCTLTGRYTRKCLWASVVVHIRWQTKCLHNWKMWKGVTVTGYTDSFKTMVREYRSWHMKKV